MATQKDQEKDNAMGLNEALLNPQQQQEQQEQPQAQPQQLSTVSAPAPTTVPTITKMPTPQQKGTGTFANLKSYLEANKGANIASAAAQKVQKTAAATQKAIKKAGQEFEAQVQAGSLANQEQALQDIQNITGAARQVTYQTPQPTTAETAPQPQQYLTPEQQERFKEVITAQYAGPASLQQTQAYNPLLEKAKATQRLVEQAQSPTQRGELLKEVFGKNREYTLGQSKLDELLLGGSQTGVNELQQAASQAGNIKKQLEAAGIETSNLASQRAATIADIQQKARDEFIRARGEEESVTNTRIEQIQKNWNKLPDYFKNLLKNTAKSGSISRTEDMGRNLNALYDRYVASQDKGTTYNLSKEEAALLGLDANQPLFITPDMIARTAVGKGEELITKDELAKQLALAELAKLDVTNQLQKDLKYTDLQKAGSKDILSSLDTAKIKNIQAEQQKKMEKELNKKLIGLFGTNVLGGKGDADLRNRLYNALDILKSGGYTPSDMQGLMAEDYSKNLLRDIAEGSSYKPEKNIKNLPSNLERAFKEASKVITDQQLARLGLPPIRDIMNKYKALDTVKVTENAQTKARAQALRNLLKDIY